MQQMTEELYRTWPPRFVDAVNAWPLGDEDRGRFWSSLEDERCYGIRPNRLKFSESEALQMLERLSDRQGLSTDWLSHSHRIPWAPAAFSFSEALRPGTDVAHLAGFYYLQEPSAMLPAEVLAAEPGEWVLDMCAAPGGKSSQIAEMMQGRGLLVSNDISEKRGLVLRRNIEQLGLGNVQVLCEDPQRLIHAWPEYFDAILLDAPCSGEGMFRRDPQAVPSWSAYGPSSCIPLQAALLDAAVGLVKPGGRIVYSTCTFNPEENEYQIQGFLDRHPHFRVVRPERFRSMGVRPGMPLPDLRFDPKDVMRIWPQDHQGEGHFCALLQDLREASTSQPVDRPFDPEWYRMEPSASGQLTPPKRNKSRDRSETGATMNEIVQTFFDKITEYTTSDFASQWLQEEHWFRMAGDHLHHLPTSPPISKHLKYLKFGTHLGEVKGRSGKLTLVPTHSFLLSMPSTAWRYALNWSMDDPRIERLIRGETLMPTDGEWDLLMHAVEHLGQGPYIPVLLEGQPLAWMKQQGRQLKNLFPQGWTRITI